MWSYGWLVSWEDIVPQEWSVVEVVLVSDGDEESPPLKMVSDGLSECEKDQSGKKEDKYGTC